MRNLGRLEGWKARRRLERKENVVIVINVYANKKYVSNAQSIIIVPVVSIQHVNYVKIQRLPIQNSQNV